MTIERNVTVHPIVKTKKRSKFLTKEALWGYFFTAPAILGLLIWMIGPMIASLYFSFTDYKIIGTSHWVGIQNYIDIFTNDLFFKKSLFVTLYFALASTLFTLIAALIVALLMNLNVKGQGFFRTMYYLPTIVPAVASNILWLWIFNPDFGLLNSILGFFGIPKLMWVYGETTAIPSLIILSVWACGGTALIFLAGLQDVPKQLLDAVEIDGGNIWHKFRYVTVPSLSPIIFFNLVMGLIGSFQAFTQAYVMTDGGPNNSTLFYVFLIYREAFQENKMGYACALSWILFIVILLFTLLVFKSAKRWVYYGGGR